MIYNTGTISINGNTATGTGTNWTAPASQVRAGQTIIVMSNPVQMFQITAINSGTSLTVTPAASPALSGQKYGILVTDSLSVDGLAQSMSQLINEYDENIGAWETFASTSANQTITVTINGTSVTIPAIGGLARKGANSDITELKGLTTALSIAQGGTGSTTASGARTNLGLGSSATKNTGTSGDSLPLLNAANTWSASQTFTAQDGVVLQQSVDSCYLTMKSSGGVVRWRLGMSGTQFVVFSYNPDGTYKSRVLSASTEQVIWGTSNTTVDTNGFIKKASPIVQLYGDGSFQLNDESEGCQVTRLSIGEYLIEGCVGLNSDAAWGGVDGGFEVPIDRNKQPLIWLDYEVNADGSVLVKTYHRTNPGAPEFARNLIGVKDEAGGFTETIKNGNPIDIPADQYVSVRVEMPSDSLWNKRQEEAREAIEKAEREQAQLDAQS